MGLFSSSTEKTKEGIDRAQALADKTQHAITQGMGSVGHGIPGVEWDPDMTGLSPDERAVAESVSRAINDPNSDEAKWFRSMEEEGIGPETFNMQQRESAEKFGGKPLFITPAMAKAWGYIRANGGMENARFMPPYGVPGYEAPSGTVEPVYREPTDKELIAGKLKPYNAPQMENPTTQLEAGKRVVAEGLPIQERDLVQRQEDSDAARAVADLRDIGSQRMAIEEMKGLYKQGGLGAQDRARLAEIQQRNAQIEKSQRDAIAQQMEMRGLGGGGQELMGALAAQQGGNQARSMESLGVEALAEQRKDALLGSIGDLGSTMREESFDEAFKRGTAADDINQFNIKSANDALMRDIAYNQTVAADFADKKTKADQDNTKMYNATKMGNTDILNAGIVSDADYWRLVGGNNNKLANDAEWYNTEGDWRSAAMTQGLYVPFMGGTFGSTGGLTSSMVGAGATADAANSGKQGQIFSGVLGLGNTLLEGAF